MSKWYLYICNKNNKLYTGITTDLKHRLAQHGKPVLIYTETFDDKTKAAKREQQIKGWTKKRKIELANRKVGEFTLNVMK